MLFRSMPWQSFDIESKVIGWDDQAFYFEQRFVVGNEIYTKAVVKIRFLKRTRGILSPDEVLAGTGDEVLVRPQLPEWVKTWNASTTLPKGKEPAPSTWN
mgnify:FL=1